MKVKTNCNFCQKEIVVLRYPSTVAKVHYCDIECKRQFQRTAKPVSREWLYEKYVVQGMGCTQISKLVDREKKTVWNWLKDLGIPTRPRGVCPKGHFVKGKLSAFYGHKHTEENKKRASERCKRDGRIPYDPAVGPPLKGKRGAEVPTWKGGLTPLRQAFYSSIEWKAVSKLVRIRDKFKCQKCGCNRESNKTMKFDIHHIVSFASEPLRCDADNLIYLCKVCHLWVHSAKNIEKEFIREIA